MQPLKRKIWTIGHSIRDIDYFISLLTDNDITLLADVRSYPVSRRHPQFNSVDLGKSLEKAGIDYVHISDLGGKRSVVDGESTLSGYEQYMKTETFLKAIEKLEGLALQQRAVYMCAEALWQQCHRSHISDALKQMGWQVIHIVDKNKLQEHSYTLKKIQGKLF